MYKKINIGRGRPNNSTQLTKVYSSQLKISDGKKKDLVKLCNTGRITTMVLSFGNFLDKLPEPSASDYDTDMDNETLRDDE